MLGKYFSQKCLQIYGCLTLSVFCIFWLFATQADWLDYRKLRINKNFNDSWDFDVGVTRAPLLELYKNAITYRGKIQYIGNKCSPGQLGNMVLTFLTLYGIARSQNMIPAFYIDEEDRIVRERTPRIFHNFSTVFPKMLEIFQPMNPPRKNITGVKFGGSWCCQYDEPERLSKMEQTYLKLSNPYMFSWRYWIQYKSDVDKFLELPPEAVDATKAIATEMGLATSPRQHLMCVHVRRKDFLQVSFMTWTTEVFGIPAIKFIYKKMKENSPEVAILFMGDDMKYAQKLAQNTNKSADNYFDGQVYFSTKGGGRADFVYAKHYCDSMLLTAPTSTFGWLLAYLGRKPQNVFFNIRRHASKKELEGHTISAGDRKKPEAAFGPDFYIPEWNALELQDNGTIRLTNQPTERAAMWSK